MENIVYVQVFSNLNSRFFELSILKCEVLYRHSTKLENVLFFTPHSLLRSKSNQVEFVSIDMCYRLLIL